MPPKKKEPRVDGKKRVKKITKKDLVPMEIEHDNREVVTLQDQLEEVEHLERHAISLDSIDDQDKSYEEFTRERLVERSKQLKVTLDQLDESKDGIMKCHSNLLVEPQQSNNKERYQLPPITSEQLKLLVKVFTIPTDLYVLSGSQLIRGVMESINFQYTQQSNEETKTEMMKKLFKVFDLPYASKYSSLVNMGLFLAWVGGLNVIDDIIPYLGQTCLTIVTRARPLLEEDEDEEEELKKKN